MKAIQFFLILLCVLLFFLGRKIANDQEVRQAVLLENYHNDTLRLGKMERDVTKLRQNLVKTTLPPQAKVNSELSKLPDLADCFQNASQGVQVKLHGLEWMGHLIDDRKKELEQNFGARYITDCSEIQFDPDFPNCGYPDLIIKVPDAPVPYVEENKGIFSFLKTKKGQEEPYESYYLTIQDTTRVRMDLWMAEFEISFRIDPDEQHKRNREFDYNGVHPITKVKSRKIRGIREFKDQRYHSMTLFVEFKPKKNWYVAQADQDGILQTNQQPQIGIAGVECLEVVKVGENGKNNNDQRIRILAEKGQALSLYNSLEDLTKVFSHETAVEDSICITTIDESTHDYFALAKGKGRVAMNPNLFGKSKYAAIPIRNLGSWKDKESNVFSGRTYTGDVYRAKFLLHLFVLGEWTVKPISMVDYQPAQPAVIEKKGIVDYILPSFGLGGFGQFISGGLILIAVFVFLSLFLAPFAHILKQIISTLQKVFGEN